MNIMVTGGAGFLGSNLSYRLTKEGHRVLLYDNLFRENVINNIMWLFANQSHLKLLQHDIRDAHRVKQAVLDYDIDAIFHFAAQTAVTTSIEKPKEDFEINALGTINILEAARQSNKNPLVVFASSNKVYGDIPFRQPVNEKQTVRCMTPYGNSKGAADQYCLDYHRMYDIPTVVLRMSCIYGNRQYGTTDQGWLAHFAFSKVNNKPITIYGDGTQVRDILYVDDFVDVCLALLEKRSVIDGFVFNIGGGSENVTTIISAAKRIGNEYIFADWRKNDQKYYVSDITRAKNILGWKPKIGVNEGIENLIIWAKSQKYQ